MRDGWVREKGNDLESSRWFGVTDGVDSLENFRKIYFFSLRFEVRYARLD